MPKLGVPMITERNSNVWFERDGVEYPLSLSVEEAEAWAKHLPVINDCLVVLYGIGYGPEVRALLKAAGKHNRFCIVEEHDAVLDIFRKLNADIKVPLLRVRDWKEFKSILLSQTGNWEHFTLAANPCYVKLWPNEFNAFKDLVLREIHCLRNDQATVRYFSGIWQENVLRNLKHMCSGNVRAGFGGWKGRPMILVSAGPSLEEALPLLRKVGDRALVCATQTTNRLFGRLGIKPHLIFSFDGDYPNWYQHFKGVELDVPLVFDPTIHWKCLEEWRGPKIGMLVHPGNRWIEERLGEFSGLYSGPSISNTLFHFGAQIGADPIIFVGQDLAYVGGKYHASHTHAEEMAVWDSEVNLERSVLLVKANNGMNVLTGGSMMSALHWFEEVIRLIEKPPLCINTSWKGCAIKGMQMAYLEDALDKYCRDRLPVREFVGSMLRAKSDPEKLFAYLGEARDELGGLVPHLKEALSIKEISKETAKRLGEVDRRIKEARPYLECIHYRLRPNVMDLEREFSPKEEEELLKRQAGAFYTAVLEAIEGSLPILEEVYEEHTKDDCIG